MAGVWKKTLNYLGLVEDDEEFVDDMPEAEPAPVRRMKPAGRPRGVRRRPRVSCARSPRHAWPTASSAIHKSEPKRFNEAREVADRFKEGTAVIMNLQSTDDTIARRLVDFASGLVYGLDGKIETGREPRVPAHARPTSRSPPRSASGSRAAPSTTSSDRRSPWLVRRFVRRERPC